MSIPPPNYSEQEGHAYIMGYIAAIQEQRKRQPQAVQLLVLNTVMTDKAVITLTIPQYHLVKEAIQSASVEDAVEAWHKGEGKIPLHSLLGLTPEEYGAWLHHEMVEEYRKRVKR